MSDLCPNLNHGRINVSIRHCPTCGEIINKTAYARCDHQRHAVLLKDRHTFCPDCGKKLAKK